MEDNIILAKLGGEVALIISLEAHGFNASTNDDLSFSLKDGTLITLLRTNLDWDLWIYKGYSYKQGRRINYTQRLNPIDVVEELTGLKMLW